MRKIKKQIKKYFSGLILLLTVLFMVSCSRSYFPLQVLVPAEVSIDNRIKHIGIVNRTIPHKRRKIVNFLEGFISGESIMADRIGAEHCLDGLAEKLNNSPGFNAVIIRGVSLRGTGTRSFPPPLPWRQVESICRRYRIDALIVLETFDSNISYRIDKRMVKRKVKKKNSKRKITVKVPKYYGNLHIDVNSGWKIYYPGSRSIVDANVYSDRRAWSAEGYSKKEVRKNLPRKREAINLAGYNSGVQYGIRISPTWLNVNRSYYVKGSPELKEAYRYVRTDDWDNAVIIWKRILADPDPELAGKAAYNIAVAAEVSGNLQKALKWAGESYRKYGNKSALKYIRIIRVRIEDEARLKEQLGEKR